MSAIALDPLIAEAQHRARRRRIALIALLVAGLGAAVAGLSMVHGGKPSAATSRVSIPAGATGAGCGVRGVGTRILTATGRTLYSEPGPYSNRGFPDIQCSGSAIWAVWFNGAATGSEAYFGARSLDRGRTWRPVFAQLFPGGNAPRRLDSYLGVWALRGTRNAYFVGLCPFCSVRGISNTNALFVTSNGGRTFSRHNLSALTGYDVRGILLRGSVVTLRAKRFIKNVSPARKTVTVRLG